MLIRLGFVSNSSSSSYLILLDNAKSPFCPTCYRREYDIAKIIECYPAWDGPNKIFSEGKSEVLHTLEEWQQDAEIIEIVKDASDDDTTAYIIAISYNDPGLRDALKRLEEKKVLEMIYLEE